MHAQFYRPMHAPSASELEILGVLAPHPASGPHRHAGIARRTRLDQAGYTAAVQQLAGRGWIEQGPEALWVTPLGEEVLGRIFA